MAQHLRFKVAECFLLLVLLFGLLLGSHAETSEMTCEADGTCSGTVPPNQKFDITVINESNFRADIHWDDGQFGGFRRREQIFNV